MGLGQRMQVLEGSCLLYSKDLPRIDNNSGRVGEKQVIPRSNALQTCGVKGDLNWRSSGSMTDEIRCTYDFLSPGFRKKKKEEKPEKN